MLFYIPYLFDISRNYDYDLYLLFHPQCYLDSNSLLNCLVELDAEVEGTKLEASPVDDDQLVDSCEHNQPSSDMEHKDQSREPESEGPKQSSPSAPKESLDKNDLSPATEIDKDAIAASVAGEIKTSHPLLETSSDNIPDEASKELTKMMDHPANALAAQDDGIEAAPSKELMVAETERNSTENSSKLSGTYLLFFEIIFI